MSSESQTVIPSALVATILDRAFGGVPRRQVEDRTDGAGWARELADGLTGLGWGEADRADRADRAGGQVLLTQAGSRDGDRSPVGALALVSRAEPGEGADDRAGEDADVPGFVTCLFDGTTRIRVPDDRPDLAASIACAAVKPDAPDALAEAERAEILDELVRWRTAALHRWSEQTAAGRGGTSVQAQALARELAAVRGTLSWRVTAPLRAVRGYRRRG